MYKTDVDDPSKAEMILDEIRQKLPGSDPSFDLEDCDRVLRIESPVSIMDEAGVQQIVNKHGYEMGVLP